MTWLTGFILTVPLVFLAAFYVFSWRHSLKARGAFLATHPDIEDDSFACMIDVSSDDKVLALCLRKELGAYLGIPYQKITPSDRMVSLARCRWDDFDTVFCTFALENYLEKTGKKPADYMPVDMQFPFLLTKDQTFLEFLQNLIEVWTAALENQQKAAEGSHS